MNIFYYRKTDKKRKKGKKKKEINDYWYKVFIMKLWKAIRIIRVA